MKLILWLERIHSDNSIGEVNDKISNWFNKFHKKFDEVNVSNISKVAKFERQLNRLLEIEEMYLSAPMVVAFQALSSSIIELKNIGLLNDELQDVLYKQSDCIWLVSHMEVYFGSNLRKLIEQSIDSIKQLNPLLRGVPCPDPAILQNSAGLYFGKERIFSRNFYTYVPNVPIYPINSIT